MNALIDIQYMELIDFRLNLLIKYLGHNILLLHAIVTNGYVFSKRVL